MSQMNPIGAGLANAAMNIPPEHPEMHRRRLNRNRRYGSNDYERFDHLAQSHASLGSAKFGKVRVDCRFLFTKSKWGVMGKQETPAGIVYLDLTFHEPKGCRLHSATVTVTLDESHKELAMVHRRSSSDTVFPPRPPVQMTDRYGPKGFVGPDKSVQKKRQIQFNPNIQAAGFGGSLANVSDESTFTSSNRWKFSTHLIPGEERDWNYEAIQWELSENDIERESAHSDVVHTAFAFHHGNQPFFMKVDVDGHLKGMRGMLRNKLSHFKASSKLDDSTAVTLINFGENHVFTKALDFPAKNLHFEMEQANLLATPMVIPDPQPVTFEATKTNVPTSNHIEDTSFSDNVSVTSTLVNDLPRPQIESESRPSRPWSAPQSIEEATAESKSIAPVLADLAKIIDSSIFPTNKQGPRRTQQQNRKVHTPARTATFQQDQEDKAQVNGSARNQSKALRNPVHVRHESTVPGMLVLMQLLMVLRNFFSRMLVDIDTATEAESKGKLHGANE
ncbi:hypothetical protein VP1G_02407 [Cytospora mali]|uniref:Uncharacterized protein n=1 Tax=Cytospora mali TaxID=578113 RepID=A0A194UTJ2_CYTMA|nr:hypothetical protein VP1G_02407 [Valsa mali var. pyri (nom. inval.)]